MSAAPVALVTGAGRGIGRATALALAREGFSVALNGLLEDDELEAATEAVQEEGVGAVSAAFDVADLSAHESALTKIEEALGPLTTLVNNAGVGVLQRGDPLEVREESWDRCLSVNAKAQFFLTQTFAKLLLSRRRDPRHPSTIVNITSSNATAVAVPRAEYCASKAAAAMVSKTWAVRLGGEGIAVYDVQPGLIETEMTTPVIDEYAARAEAGLTVVPRVGVPEEIGTIIATLAAGGLPYTTGQVINADGGLLISRF